MALPSPAPRVPPDLTSAPGATRHLLLPSLLVWEQPFAVPRSGCPARWGKRKDPSSRFTHSSVWEEWEFRSNLACFSWVKGREGRVPSLVRLDASSRSRSHNALDVAVGRGQQQLSAGKYGSARPPLGLESWGEGRAGLQHRGAAESGRRWGERPVTRVGCGGSRLRS